MSQVFDETPLKIPKKPTDEASSQHLRESLGKVFRSFFKFPFISTGVAGGMVVTHYMAKPSNLLTMLAA